MAQAKGSRNSNGRSSIYFSDSDKSWHGWVTVGTKDNGKPDRRHVRGKNKTEVSDKVRKLEAKRDAGKVQKAGQVWTVEKWLQHWLETSSRRRRSPRIRTSRTTSPSECT